MNIGAYREVLKPIPPPILRDDCVHPISEYFNYSRVSHVDTLCYAWDHTPSIYTEQTGRSGKATEFF
jgi:hypothetical protein